MSSTAELWERARLSRDRRFDGRFFIGVVTTGVYCRPVCPVKPPRAQNVRFYPSAAAAEEAGFRPCRRCRPETSPGTPAWVGSSASVSRALRLIQEGALARDGVDALADRLGIGSRHLRRLFAEHLGASPLAVASTRRVHFARRLIDETRLPMSEIAYASGFGSIRQFNHSVRATFGRTPTELRGRSSQPQSEGRIRLRLSYRPPLDWTALLDFLRARAIPGVESVNAESYRRVVDLGGVARTLHVTRDAEAAQLILELDGAEPAGLMRAVEGVRRIFDLGADPLQVANDLAREPDLGPRIRARPGLRVPGAWDPFELAVRAILGQQVSVAAATTLAGRLVQSFGKPLESSGIPGLTHVFPTPEALAAADVATIGLPAARGEAVRRLASALSTGELCLEGVGDLDASLDALRALPGIGEWTAQYVAMRALAEPDAFPASDLGLRRALANGAGTPSAAELLRRAEAWRPWRAYAAMWLWTCPTTLNTKEVA